MILHVHLLDVPDETLHAHLCAQLDPNVIVTTGERALETADLHILVGGRPTRDQFAANPNLHTLIIPWAGLPAGARDLVRREFPHVAIHNLHHNAAPVAELALALFLAAAKFIVPYDRALRRRDWRMRYARPGPSVLLDGKTALVLGYGHIGRRVARGCRALGMTVLAVRRNSTASADADADEIHPPEALRDLLPRAQALLICLPHTPHTDGLLGAAELALLPPRSVLVNIGRGAIVQEQALYAALQNGVLHAAGLDVWYNYPADVEARSQTPPSAYPFHELDNVVMSPHRGGDTADTERRRMTHLAALLNAAARGEPIPNRVDIEAGY